MANNNGCLIQSGLILTWIVLIFTVLGVFAFSTTWGIIFAVVIIIVKIATQQKKEVLIDNQTEVAENNDTVIETEKDNLKIIDKNKTKEELINIDSELTEIEKERFLDLCQKFSELQTCSKIWFVKSLGKDARLTETIDRQEISFSVGNMGTYKIPIINDIKGNEFDIYPKYILTFDSSENLKKIPIETIDINYKSVRFIEDLSHEIHIAELLNKPFSYEENLPKDAKIVDYNFQYTNKNGSPNLRYSFNPKLPIMEYGCIEIEPLGLKYYFSNTEAANQFVNTFNIYTNKKTIEDTNSQNITDEYFKQVNKYTNKLLDLYNYLKENHSFLQIINEHNLETNTTADEKFRRYFMIDIITSYTKLNNSIDINTKEGLGLLILLIKTSTETEITQQNQLSIFVETATKLLSNYLDFRDVYSKIENNTNLFLPNIIGKYNAEMQKNYLIALYRFASIAAKADNKVTEDEQKWLSELLKLSDNNPEENGKEEVIELQPKIKSIKPKTTKLKSLIGLASVKEEIETLTNFIKIKQTREAKGLKTSSVSYHCVFTGNPGTGKTTVARIVADIYKSLGILAKGHLVETDRSGLVAEYVGQTAVKTNKIIDSALDGVLFIDEAYSLISKSENDYGKEAIATLLKRMEDNRDRLIVILAGYSAEMQQFIDSNPGLQSRFNRYIEFPDYSADELYQIFEKNAKEFDYKISKDAEIPLKEYFANKVANKDKNFGNARFVRNLFEKTIERQANRLSKEVDLTDEKLSEICTIDIPM